MTAVPQPPAEQRGDVAAWLDRLEEDEADRFVEMRAALLSHGYVVKDHHNELRAGARVRIRGERYPEAYDRGTGVVLLVTEMPNSPWSRTWGGPDVELIVLKDKPLLPGMSRLAQVANYHVAVVTLAAALTDGTPR